MTALNAPVNFNWPLAYEAEALLSTHINAFLEANRTAGSLAGRMRDETGTDFFEWVDHFVVSQNHEQAFRDAGFAPEAVDVASAYTVLKHPHAMLPRLLVSLKARTSKVPSFLAIRPEYLADFMARNGLKGEPAGSPGSRFRMITIAAEGSRAVPPSQARLRPR